MLVDQAQAALSWGCYWAASVSTTIVIDSTISSNTADLGGGIYNEGPLTLAGTTTVSGNNATSDGGGIINEATGVITLEGTSSVHDNSPNNCVGTTACEP